MEALPALTFRDLESEARNRAQRAHESGQKSWLDLADLIADFRTHPAGQRGELVNETNPWWIESLTVSGFRGVNGEVTCRFETSPGLTVIHGFNGSGKSSLCHALDVTLHQDDIGSIPLPAGGAGGKTPLWAPVLPFRGGPSVPTTRVTLVRTGHAADRLELTWGTDGTSRQVAFNDKHLTADQLEPWKSALLHRLPVYSYADWERRITVAKDMQSYLSSLLAFGGIFAAIDNKLNALLQANSPGVADLQHAHRALQSEIDEVAVAFDYPSPVDVPPWPLNSDVADLERDVESALGGHQSNATTLDADSILGLRESIEELAARLSLLDLAAARQDALDTALAAIHESDTLDSEHCPVCGTPGDWRSHLQQRLQKSAQGRAAMSDWDSSLRTVIKEVTQVLALSPSLLDRGLPLYAAGAALNRLQAAATAAPHALADATVEAVRAAHAELGAEDFEDHLQEMAANDRALITAQNRLQAAFNSFLTSWRNNSDALTQEATVKAMRSRLRELEKHCSDDRATAVTGATDPLVKNLLTDAGITLGGVKVQRRTASFQLQWTSDGKSVDSDGEVTDPMNVEMGMLSAGQRNAIILAPALAVARGGPFAFRFFDDPVHAFDQLRIDRVSETLLALAQTQRVVVMTHDERFKEHLATAGLCRGIEVDVWEIDRRSSGEITLNNTDVMWRTLIKDAESLLSLNKPTALATSIRGLLRQSVDSALRTFTMREAFEGAAIADEWLSTLDLGSVMTTEKRFEAVLKLDMSEQAIALAKEAQTLAAKHKGPWNQAMHGNPPQSPVTQDEIDDCRRIGELLWNQEHVL